MAHRQARRKKLLAMGQFEPAFVDATGSRRRLQALMVLGYTAGELGSRMGMTRYVVHDIIETDRQIRRDKHFAIVKVYDELWNTPAQLNQGSRYVANLAAKRGYAPALAWDDGELDDPEASPCNDDDEAVPIDEVVVLRILDGTLTVLTTVTPELVEAVARLALYGLTDAAIGTRIGRSRDAVLKIRARNDIPAGMVGAA